MKNQLLLKKFINSERNTLKDESSEKLELYFSWHERMINGKYLDSEQTVFNDKSIVGFSSIHDSRELVSMPELWRSSLMDQIDYDLDHYKINESSMYSYSIDQSNNMQNKQFVRAKAQLEVIEDINPKFMNFLNDGQKVLRYIIWSYLYRPSNSSQNSINSQNCESANWNKKPKESNHQNISYKM